MTEIEQSIIGNLLLAKNLQNQKKLTNRLLPDFFSPDAKKIMEVFITLNRENTKCELIHLQNFDRNILLFCIAKHTQASDYNNLLKELSKEYLARETDKIKNEKDFLKAKRALQSAEEKSQLLEYTKPKTVQDVFNEALQNQMDNPFDLDALPKTGFNHFDEVFRGFMPGQLVTIGGYSGVGKSTLIFSLLRNLSTQKKTLLYSLEMQNEMISSRIFANLSGVPFDFACNLGNPKVQEMIDGYGLRDKCNKGIAAFDKLNLSLYDNKFNIGEIVSSIRSIHENDGVDFVMIDYLQLVQPLDNRLPRHEQIGQVTRELKRLAAELEITIIILAQLSRASLLDEEPDISHLRESGSIEQDSDYVFLIYKDKDNNRKLKLAKDRMFAKYHIAKLKFNIKTQAYE